MKKINLTIFLFFAAGIFFAVPKQTSAQIYPGSYLKSCTVEKVDSNTTIIATCADKGSGKKATFLKFAFLCDGDIANINGNLQCNKSVSKPQYQSAKKTFNQSWQKYLGRDIGVVEFPKDTPSPYINKADGELLIILTDYFGSSLNKNFPQDYQNMKTGNYADKKAKESLRYESEEVINRAYMAVLNKPASATQKSDWTAKIKAGSAWYETIVNELKKPIVTLPIDSSIKIKMVSETLQMPIVNPGDGVKVTGTKTVDASYFVVENWQDFSASMFAPAQDLAPCKSIQKAARTWLYLYDRYTNSLIQTNCQTNSPEELKKIKFAVDTKKLPGCVYIKMIDRKTNKIYTSQGITTDGKNQECFEQIN